MKTEVSTGYNAFSQERPSSTSQFSVITSKVFGLSKERPILGDHARTHIFGLCSENTPIKPWRST